jgi:hypothetical protein
MTEPRPKDSIKHSDGSPCLSPSVPDDGALEAIAAQAGRFALDAVVDRDAAVPQGDVVTKDAEELEFDDNPLPVSNSLAVSTGGELGIARSDRVNAPLSGSAEESTDCGQSVGTPQQNTPEKYESQQPQSSPAKRSALLDSPLPLSTSSVLPQPIALNPDFESSILDETESNYRFATHMLWLPVVLTFRKATAADAAAPRPDLDRQVLMRSLP